MALLDEDPSVAPDDESESSGSGGRVVVIALALIVVVAGAYFFLSSPEPEPVVAERAAPPPPAPEPEPEPEPDPEPVRPAPQPESEPEPEPEPQPPAAPTNVLRVTSDVDGAQVFLDRRFLGNTPLDMTDLEPGRHQVNVAATGYEGIVQTVDIGPDDPVELNVEFRVVRLDEAIDVVHTHRFGSCSGRLVANLQGFHYQTDHDDAFSVSLDDVDAFELDYLDQTLSLAIRGGRTYNFTDEQDTADPLFVFHRDVEEARTRLAEGDRPATGG
ncbi:MAG: PEGA domain-containing protein [Vicinamibacterales bacterium]|nr:PEGA domain-containing protein [Vicinamibacterales bacterium]